MNTHTPSPPDKDIWIDRLQASGYRITAPLRTLVDLLIAAPRPLSPLVLYDLARETFPRLGLVTVYRTLEKLEELHLVTRVHQPGGCHAYLRAAQGHEHLLICDTCGASQFFCGDNLTNLIDKVSRDTGFVIREHWLQLHGLCQACQAA